MVYGHTLKELKKEFPLFVIRYKSRSPLMKAVALLLKILSGGRSSTFLTDFVTTVGSTLYVPNSWMGLKAEDRVVILRHERIHMRQQRRLGLLRFFFTYFVWPFPVLFAKGRRDLEREAYEETLRTDHYFYGFIYVEQPGYRQDILNDFKGPRYMWMWASTQDNEVWFDSALARLRADVARTSA